MTKRRHRNNEEGEDGRKGGKENKGIVRYKGRGRKEEGEYVTFKEELIHLRT